ncbi:PREDICTED: activating transcription factor 7-interacting protein 1 isoform X3 [Dinoponera quadriceps]|uniref:Activating transcription factor 7-interacting protein 1 isoform X3 n=1 Tax=Dinoponera quadriceps TaxID=609295 RepID=A0A6P3WN01_DINQU|nr:PREDICTED: activating transcription factor 7-interacting protein 1 isoform X3 [Dinoponera quadriceps]
MMEAVQNESVHDTNSNSAVSCIDETNTDELLKEKDELLFGAEEDGEDEDALSDDSLRLRLSDDEDPEQEDITKNQTNVSEFKAPNKIPEPSKDIITEETSSSAPQQVVEEEMKSGSKKLTPKQSNSAINLQENSALPSECTSENKLMHNEHNLEDSTTVTKSSEKYTLNICDKVKSDEIFQVANNTESKMHLNHVNNDKSIVEIQILNDNFQKEDNNSVIKYTFNSAKDKNVKIIEEGNVCEKQELEENISDNDRLPVDNLAETTSCQNVELTNDSEDKLKATINKYDEKDSVDTCGLNNLNTADDYDELICSAKIKSRICNVEMSTTTVIPDQPNDTLTILIDNEETITQKGPLTEIKDDHDSTDTIKTDSSEDTSSSFKYSSKSKVKTENLEHESVTRSANTPKTQSIDTLIQQEITIALTETQNDAIDKAEMTNEDRDVNKPISEITDNNTTSTKSTSLTPVNVEDNENKSNNTGTIVQRRKRLKRTEILDISAVQDRINEENKQEIGSNGRQKRRTARNAEEIIRRKYLNSDSDFSDSDSEGRSVTLSSKSSQNVSSTSSASLKRNFSENDDGVVFNGIVKKVRISPNSEKTNGSNDITNLSFVEKFSQRNGKDKFPKLTNEQLEELLIQKIAETITMRSEIGILREQARISERNQEAMRTKLQQLTKQVKDFEMVLNRNALDRRVNPEKTATPIKINRSVGLQVNFVTEHGMQNLRQVQQSQQKPLTNAPNPTSAPASELATTNNTNVNTSPRRGIKIRSPRRSETSTVVPSAPTVSQCSMQTTPLVSTVTPAALVVAKPVDTQQTITLPNQSNIQLLSGNMSQQQQIQPQTYVVNGKIQNQSVNRPNTTLVTATTKSRSSDLIDLTDEEEKNKSAKVTATSTPTLIEQLSTVTTTKPICFPRVIQALPTNVAITTQPASIRVVQPNQPPPTATIVNNGGPPRLAYVMQSSTTRQLLIAQNTSQIRPITTCRVTTSFPTVAYKTGTSTIANGTVRVITTPAVSNVPNVPANKVNIRSNPSRNLRIGASKTLVQHPAPLPDTPTYAFTPGWKLPPPAPSLKMSKVPNGIVLSWNVPLTDKHADIVSYQLYAYQEVTGVSPNTSLWKKVGDVRALPLPMACTLTQFSEGNNYYFAVRAVDTHSRKGQYSIPGNISL